MKKLIVLLLLFSASFIQAQMVNYSGRIINPDSVGVFNASVKVLNSRLETLSSQNGDFNFTLKAGNVYTIYITAQGYSASQHQVRVSDIPAEHVFILNRLATHLEEVVVTAQKREERLQQIPISVTAITSKRAEEYQIWNTREITAIVPNFYSANPGDNRNVTSIRGIATTSYDPAVVTYIDGVNQFGLDTYFAQLLDIERIEILRGPQGTMYGRNAMGGVVNIITKQPSNQIKGFAELSMGNYSSRRYSGGIQSPLINGRLFLGVAGLYQSQNGFYTNTYNNKSFDSQHGFSGNYYLKYLAGKNWGLTLNVKNSTTRNNGAFPLNSSSTEAMSSPFKLSQDAITTMVDNLFNSSLSANYYGSAINFYSITAYQSNNRYYKSAIDADFSPIDAVSLVNNYGTNWNTVKVATQEFRLSSSASPKLKWMTGIYSFFQESPVKQGIHFGKDAEMIGAPFPSFTSINTNKGRAYGAALYGDLTYMFNSRLELSAGLRYDYEYRKLAISAEFQSDGESAMITRSDTSSSADFNALSPKLALTYHVNDHQNLYASYNT